MPHRRTNEIRDRFSVRFRHLSLWQSRRNLSSVEEYSRRYGITVRLLCFPRWLSKSPAPFLVVLYCFQQQPEPFNIAFILEMITIAVPVIPDDLCRIKQRLDIFQAFVRQAEKADPRIQQQRFQPPLLQQGHRMRRNMADPVFCSRE